VVTFILPTDTAAFARFWYVGFCHLNDPVSYEISSSLWFGQPPSDGGAQTVKMAALGDSYSSGEGTYSYDANSQGARCHRGPDAWPRKVEAGVAEISQIDHRACTGAKTAQLFTWYNSNPPQIPRTPDTSVELVTISIGGNDVGFADILRSCYLAGSSCANVPDSQNFEKSLNRLYRQLVDSVYPALRKAYPNARIAHVGYPQILPAPGTRPVRCGWLSEPEQNAAQKMAAKLNGTIYLATKAGEVDWVDVTNALAGHELCTADPWMVDLSFGPFNSERGHPDADGQKAIALVVGNALGYSFLPQY
jgi:lysophospholipase L1-like esterase